MDCPFCVAGNALREMRCGKCVAGNAFLVLFEKENHMMRIGDAKLISMKKTMFDNYHTLH
jgi:hypothetical protein